MGAKHKAIKSTVVSSNIRTVDGGDVEPSLERHCERYDDYAYS
jgi:hypothetical protein